MASQDSFFNTSVGEQRGIPPLRLEHGHCAKIRPPASSHVTLLQDSDAIQEEVEVLQERTQHFLDSSSSETNYHTRLVLNDCSTIVKLIFLCFVTIPRSTITLCNTSPDRRQPSLAVPLQLH